MISQSQIASLTVIPPRLAILLPYYILIMAVLVFYSGVYDNAFLYDDKYLVLRNSYLRSWHSLLDIFTHYVNSGADRYGRFYRPLQNVIYLLIYQFCGPSQFAFHALNIGLHAANACLVYRLGIKLGFAKAVVFLAAAVWALHPVQTEAVTYVSSTADTLSSLFCLLGIVVLLPDFGPRRLFLACVCIICGLLTKESAIVFPLLALSVWFYDSPGQTRIKDYTRLWPLALVAAGYLLLRFLLLPIGSDDLLNIDPVSQIYAKDILVRLYTFLATLPAYAALLLWPVGLHMDRGFSTYLNPWEWEVGGGIALIIASLAIVLAAYRNKNDAWRPAAFGLLWFAGAHVTQTGVFVPVNSLFLEHWMYLPSAGLFLGSSQTLWLVCKKKQFSTITFQASGIIVALALGIMTYRQNEIWHDAFRFYGHILAQGESSYRAHNNLGIAYLDIGDYPRAMEQFQYNVDHYDLSPEAHQNIAAVLSKLPDAPSHIEEEIMQLKRALEINRTFIPAYLGLAEIYRSQGRMDEAADMRRQADLMRQRILK